MHKNRQQRRAEKSAFKKQIKHSEFDAFENQTERARELMSKCRIGEFQGFYVNSIYSVQKYKRNSFTLLGIRRHDQASVCPWPHKQRIKNEIVGEDASAIEIFPPQSEVVDSANMYWLWCGEKIDDLYKLTGGINSMPVFR